MDRWGAICFALSATGLFLIALSFTRPWYVNIDGDGNSTGMALAGLGVFLWWVFVVTSVLRPSRLRPAIGWLAVSLVLLSLVVTLTFYPIRQGWFLGIVAVVPMTIAAATDLKRGVLLEKSEDSGGPFEGDGTARI